MVWSTRGRRSGRRRARGTALAAAGLVAVLLPACDPPVRTEVVVTDAGTAGDASPGDGVCEATTGAGDCTFRAAIEETNAQPSADVITIAEGVTPTPGGAVPITGSLEIRGGGATLGERIVHTAGALVLKHLTIAGASGATTCGGAVASEGDSVALDRVTVTGNATSAPSGGGICAEGAAVLIDVTVTENLVGGAAPFGAALVAGGDIVVVRSRIEGNRHAGFFATSQVASTGTGRLEILSSTLRSFPTQPVLSAAGASGRILASWLEGTSILGPAITVGATRMGACAVGAQPTSAGHNSFTDTSCGTTGTDRVDLSPSFDAQGVPEAWSPLVDAILAGTPGLCPGPLPTDQRGSARPLFGACDIGPVERTSRVRATRLTTIGELGDIGVPVGPWEVAAVDDGGTSVGMSLALSPTWTYLATRWDPDGTATFLSITDSAARGISSDGRVVGRWTPSSGRSHAFWWDPATEELHDLGTLPGDTDAVAEDVEGSWIVGSSRSASSGPRPWAATGDAGPVELPGLGGGTGEAVAVDAAGRAVGWATTADGDRRAVVWDLVAGTVADIGAGAAPHTSAAVDVGADGTVIGTIDRPDLGEDCNTEFEEVPPCPFSQAFRWDPATGELQQIEGLLGPVSAVALGPGGTVVEVVRRNVLDCSGCPKVSNATYLYDPATGEHVRLSGSFYFGAVDATSDGVVVGNDITGNQPGAFLPTPSMLRVTLAG